MKKLVKMFQIVALTGILLTGCHTLINQAEELHKKSFIGIEVCLYRLNIKDIDLIIKSFQKVWKKLKI